MVQPSSPALPMSSLRHALERAVRLVEPFRNEGTYPRGIPALARVPRSRLGVAIATVDGALVARGDAEEPFSIQSISKVFSLAMALDLEGSRLWRRVSDCATDDPFDAVEGAPRGSGRIPGPFLNAGALIVTDAIERQVAPAASSLRAFIRSTGTGIEAGFDRQVANSEMKGANRNRAIAELLVDRGLVTTHPDKLVGEYTRACSIAMNCSSLARAGLVFAAQGRSVLGERLLPPRHVASVNAMMALGGLYRASGLFARYAGIPAKSGVGGGVLAVVPGRMCIAAWSPGLDAQGNSVVGLRLVELLARHLKLSVFRRGPG